MSALGAKRTWRDRRWRIGRQCRAYAPHSRFVQPNPLGTGLGQYQSLEKGLGASARTATRRADGSTSRMSSRVFAPVSADAEDKSVILPPGRTRLEMRPVPTGSPAGA